MKADGGTLTQKISSFLFAYRCTPHCTTKCTPAELFLGRRLRTRFDILRPNLTKKVNQSIDPSLSTKKTRRFTVGDVVLARDYFDKKNKWKRGVIVAQLGPVTYRVQIGELIWKRHINQLCLADSELPAIDTHVIPEQLPDLHVSTDIANTPSMLEQNSAVHSQVTSTSEVPNECVIEVPNDSLPDNSVEPCTLSHSSPRRSGRIIRKPSRLIEQV